MYEDQTGPLAQPEPPKRRSILDGVLASLYPAGGYEGVIPPEMLAEQRRLALRKTGLSLLASSDPMPQGTRRPNADLAAALSPDDWSQRLSAVAQQSLQMDQMQKKAQRQAQVAQIVQHFSPQPKPDGSPESQQEAADRYRQMSAAFMQAGDMENATTAMDLSKKAEAPALGVHNNLLYDTRTGTVVGGFPEELKTVDGSQLYSNAVNALDKWNPVRQTVTQYNAVKNAPLTPPNTAALISAAQSILQTHGSLVASDNSMDAIKNLAPVGILKHLIDALTGVPVMSVTQKRELVEATDKMVALLDKEHSRVVSDQRRIFKSKYRDEAAFKGMWGLLPDSPGFGPAKTSAIADEIDRETR